ncbi:MAG: hypothetical protein AAB495_00825 [Patescibacteria group bacterium]
MAIAWTLVALFSAWTIMAVALYLLPRANAALNERSRKRAEKKLLKEFGADEEALSRARQMLEDGGTVAFESAPEVFRHLVKAKDDPYSSKVLFAWLVLLAGALAVQLKREDFGKFKEEKLVGISSMGAPDAWRLRVEHDQMEFDLQEMEREFMKYLRLAGRAFPDDFGNNIRSFDDFLKLGMLGA